MDFIGKIWSKSYIIVVGLCGENRGGSAKIVRS